MHHWRQALSLGKNPTLAYLYRTYLARQLLDKVKPGRFLEIGVGSGAFYQFLEGRGFRGLCVDLNPRLIEEHRSRQISPDPHVEFVAGDFFALEETFDLVVAFEVLEHFRDDMACLRKWFELLDPGGTLLISVPAHSHQWTSNDTKAGHARRYEKAELKDRLSEQRFQIREFWCYGFPILNWTYFFSQFLDTSGDPGLLESVAIEPVKSTSPSGLGVSASSQESKGSSEFLSSYSRTANSGTRRFRRLSRWVFYPMLWWPFLQLQKPFLEADVGIGYLALCERC